MPPPEQPISATIDVPADVDFDLVAHIIRLLQPLSPADRLRVLNTIAIWLRIGDYGGGQPAAPSHLLRGPEVGPTSSEEKFSGRQEIGPKDFLFEKDPQTDGERMAVLAYYLTHFRDTPHFKTEDLSKLNTEAAQRRFANAAYTSKNAMRDGFFVQAPKAGFRQLSAMGERFVQALPDREAAMEVRRRAAGRRPKRTGPSAINGAEEPVPESTES